MDGGGKGKGRGDVGMELAEKPHWLQACKNKFSSQIISSSSAWVPVRRSCSSILCSNTEVQMTTSQISCVSFSVMISEVNGSCEHLLKLIEQVWLCFHGKPGGKCQTVRLLQQLLQGARSALVCGTRGRGPRRWRRGHLGRCPGQDILA